VTALGVRALQTLPAMPRTLFSPADHHDACGVGFVATLTNLPSHAIVTQGLEILVRLDHRGAIGADGQTGDGCGLTVQLPDAFLCSVAEEAGVALPPQGDYALAMLFLPEGAVDEARALVERILLEERIPLLWWREVPTEAGVPGPIARQSQPAVAQAVVARPEGVERGADFERALYIARRRIEREAPFADPFAVVSFSSRTTTYKGMLTPAQLAAFYPDLRDSRFKSALAMVHSRFSTNTLPQWPLAQPFRTLCHNGEINTVLGNRNAWRAREAAFFSSAFGRRLKDVVPTLDDRDSDSKSLDGALELLVHAGWPLPQAIMALVPEAWEHAPDMDPGRRAFYEAFACALEPWDGPATIQFTDGSTLGAVLDRNGLRPSRYTVTSDGLVVLSSETGVLDLDPATIVEKGRLEPGRMLLLDLDEGRIVSDREIKAGLATDAPYDAWLARGLVRLDDLRDDAEAAVANDGLSFEERLRLYGYTQEDLGLLIPPMASDGKEALGSMGDDTPIAALSDRPRLLFDRFRQRFAQVTNPPLDAIREELVTSLITHLGEAQNVLEPGPELCRRLRLEQPVLTPDDLARVRAFGDRDPAFRTATLDATLGPDETLADAVARLVTEAASAIERRASILILSDSAADAERAPIPSLLAVGAVHHGLIRRGLRTFAELVVETGEAREVHHVAALVGYGAAAVCPTLLVDTVRWLAESGHIEAEPDAAVAKTVKAIGKGLLKVLSKMGISTLRSYQGAQIFEALGLHDEVVEAAFAGTPSRIGGATFADLEAELRQRHAQVGTSGVDVGGRYQWRRGGERHAWGPEAIVRLQQAVRADETDAGRYASFAAFSESVDDLSRRRSTLRSLLDFVHADEPAEADAVEPWSDIVTRFKTGAMSYGSISQEAHETLAVAMNRLGGKSNTGEGGEDPARYPRSNPARSRIKQIASGRFGVTAEYLATADEIQIKMAQGAKPGEGGQLPGFKVVGAIAEARHATPGVGLVSPPPHHDIYSIEDLAQLIFDLKTVNPDARITVKLVSEAGIGTIAAGVAKAGADTILVSGSDGGTGAAAQTSIAHAGLPWELGLAEVQQALRATGLRNRVRLEVDGHLKTGRDVVIGALLGADEFGFATAPLVAMGCIMMRKCHLNACPVGIATQDEALRSHFRGTPENVVTYFHFVAEEARQILAALGLRTLAEARGRVDLLTASPGAEAAGLDLGAILAHVETPDILKPFADDPQGGPVSPAVRQEARKSILEAVDRGERAEAALDVRNSDRAFGTRLSGALARRSVAGAPRLADDSVVVRARGSAGQSLGAFGARGLTIRLEGDANDYVGKGLSGARLVVVPPAEAAFVPSEQVLIGNVALYGATSGALFARGRAGERFAVRNSGATAVVEGVGDHGCEYMTGGRVVVLGKTGRNFGAGMSGGKAYVLDADGQFVARRVNPETVDLLPVARGSEDAEELRQLLEAHAAETGSETARILLDDWPAPLRRFVLVFPTEYRRALAAESGAPIEHAPDRPAEHGEPAPADVSQHA
jgi:glutamate synthase domain-containing protein 2/glutamate synthase domain-containing protein 1/glutamate synthase domain-containing protein 3